jgi:hypothetical protein
LAQFCYLSIFVQLGVEVYNLARVRDKVKLVLETFCYFWVLLNCLIQPTHNTIVIALWTLLNTYLTSISGLLFTNSPNLLLYFYYIISQFCHFVLGNSNSLNTISLHSGMVGVNDELNELAVAVLLLVATYAAFVYWIFALALQVLR